jgi:hypothetical protein
LLVFIKANIVSQTEASKTWHSTRLLSEMHRELEKLKIDTMDKVFSLAIKKNGMKRCFGTREMISEDDEIQVFISKHHKVVSWMIHNIFNYNAE